MWLIVGLGNPGRKYAKTRHNAGFMVIEEIAERYGFALKAKELYRLGEGSIEGIGCILMEPLTFMNRSGFAVLDVMRRYRVGPENLIVIHDDIDMDIGKLKIRRRGSPGGHKGVESIIRNTGTGEFIRVKVGIGRSRDVPVEEYVLGRFNKEEAPLIRNTLRRAADSVVLILKDGVDRAMNIFNRAGPGM